MLNLLNTSVGEYLKDNVVLTVVLALILALIAVLAGIMIYLQLKAKKSGNMEASGSSKPLNDGGKAEEPATTPQEEPAKQETPLAPVAEKASYEEPVAEKTQETPQEEPAKQEAENQTNDTTTEPVSEIAQKKPSTAKKPAAKKPAAKKPVKSDEKDDEKSVGFQDGKWIISKTDEGKYTFQLFASNGSVMLESSKEYSSLSTAKQGIETYKRNFAENHCKIVSTKPGHFVYRLTNANGMLLAVSPNYTSKSSCENALESTKTYAKGAPVEVNKG